MGHSVRAGSGLLGHRMPAYTGAMSNDMGRLAYRPRHLAPSPTTRSGATPYRPVGDGPSAAQVLTTLLVGLLLLCGIYQFAAAGLGPARHGSHPAQGQASTASQSASQGLSGHEGAAPVQSPTSKGRTPQQAAQDAPHARGRQPLLDPSAGRGADSPTCRHAPRSPRCRLEGGSGLSVPTNRSPQARGLALAPATDDGQTLLLDRERAVRGGTREEVTSPRQMPGRVPGRGGWVSEQGRSRA